MRKDAVIGLKMFSVVTHVFDIPLFSSAGDEGGFFFLKKHTGWGGRLWSLCSARGPPFVLGFVLLNPPRLVCVSRLCYRRLETTVSPNEGIFSAFFGVFEQSRISCLLFFFFLSISHNEALQSFPHRVRRCRSRLCFIGRAMSVKRQRRAVSQKDRSKSELCH